jgi:peptidoglycan/LPS O-acetylase OafA/YrhL
MHLASQRSNNFDFLRFALASLVIVSHSYAILDGTAQHELAFALSRGKTTFGVIAVNGFFVISGFLITQSWLRGKGLADYCKKRAIRILPAYYVAALFCAVVVGALASASPYRYLRALNFYYPLVDLAQFHTFWSHHLFSTNPLPGELNGSLWTIRYELWCYFLVPILAALTLLRRRWIILAMFICTFAFHITVTAAKVESSAFWILGTLQDWLRLLTYFLAGIVLFLFREKILIDHRLALACFIVILAVAPLGFIYAVLPVFGTYLLYYLAFGPGLKLQNFGGHGDFSYGIYLYAFPVQQLLVYYIGAHLAHWSLSALAFLISLALAFLSWHLVERRFLAMRRKTTERAKAHSLEPLPSATGD